MATLRQFIDQCGNLKNIVGSIFQIRLVLDTNVVISDLLWITKRGSVENQPAIVEVIRAGTLIAYAPEQLKNEIDQHLPDIAKKKNIPIETLQNEWQVYQQYIEFVAIDKDELVAYEDSVDPKDAPFVVLSRILGVSGVISNDPDIEKIGGKRIHIDIRLDLRDYSRTAAIAYSFKVGGVLISVMTIEALTGMGEAIVKLVKRVGGMPDNAKLFLLGAIVLIFTIPTSRNYIFEKISALKGVFGESWITLGPLLQQLIAEAQHMNETTNQHLANIHNHIATEEIEDA